MIFIAADHGGYELKEKICHRLANRGVTFEDFGTFSKESIDYPGFAKQVAKAVIKHDGKGILFCRSGQGMAIAANRYKGIRAALAWNPRIAEEARDDNNANIVSLPADFLSEQQAWDIITTFLSTPFSREARHLRRIKQLDER
jgi:ribose 5-phosphate isomerase B